MGRVRPARVPHPPRAGRIESTAPNTFLEFLPPELRTAEEIQADNDGGRTPLGIPLAPPVCVLHGDECPAHGHAEPPAPVGRPSPGAPVTDRRPAVSSTNRPPASGTARRAHPTHWTPHMPMPETPRPQRPTRPGNDRLPDERLAEIRAEVDDNDGRGLRLQEAIELLGELDRIRPLLATTLDTNGKLLDKWSRYVGVVAAIGRVFCWTCRTGVQPGTEGCPRHSPTVVGRELYRLHDERRARPAAERNARAYELLGTDLPLLAAVLNPIVHAQGCRPHACRCARDRRQNCQGCHRCVC